jgi:hypothetical protein
VQYSDATIDLCTRCTRDEMELYWRRYGTAKPTGVGAAPSLVHVRRWPFGPMMALQGSMPHTQDLCMCARRLLGPYYNHCHACRDRMFALGHTNPHHRAEDFLRGRNKGVITERKACELNGGTRAHRVQARHVSAREANGIGRTCPCGERPDVRHGPAKFINVCMVCMGVTVRGHLIPPQYSQAQMAAPTQLRRSARLAVRAPPVAGIGRTRGSRKAIRSAMFRVNIERGWVPNDPLIGFA